MKSHRNALALFAVLAEPFIPENIVHFVFKHFIAPNLNAVNVQTMSYKLKTSHHRKFKRTGVIA